MGALTLVLGALWAWAWPAQRLNAATPEFVATQILRDQRYAQNDLVEMLQLLSRPDQAGCQSRSLFARMVLSVAHHDGAAAEQDRLGLPPPAQSPDLEETTRRLLACSPYQPFAWYILAQIEKAAGATDARIIELLAMSYRLGAAEAWIARHRSTFIASHFTAEVPESLKKNFEQEVLAFVRDDYLEGATSLYWIVTPALRGRLLEAVSALPAQRRNRALRFIMAGVKPR